jgi:hypothetical protein
MSPTLDPLLHDIWKRQGMWSRAADRAKAEVGAYRITSLVLVVIASALGAGAPVVASVNDGAGRVFGLVAGVALGLIPLVRYRLSGPTYERWSRMRSIGEALKGEVYRCLPGSAPYRACHRAETLLTRCAYSLEKGDDLAGRLVSVERRERPLPEVTDVPTYIEQRVERQIREYYRPRGLLMARRARIVRGVQAALAVGAVVLGVVASAGQTSVAPWVGVIGTISGSIIAHSAAARYVFLQIEYFRTAEQLERLLERHRYAASPSEGLDDWFVYECERIISAQNDAWMTQVVTVPGESPVDASIPPPV